MMTPPLSIWARPRLTVSVPVWCCVCPFIRPIVLPLIGYFKPDNRNNYGCGGVASAEGATLDRS